MSTRKQIVGNLTGDPELRFSQSGKGWTTFTVASNEGKDDNQRTCFTRCKAFGDIAENIAESLTKGTRVIVHGREQTEEWETNGEKRSGNVLIVDAIGPELRFATAKVTRTTKVSDRYGQPQRAPLVSTSGPPLPTEAPSEELPPW